MWNLLKDQKIQQKLYSSIQSTNSDNESCDQVPLMQIQMTKLYSRLISSNWTTKTICKYDKDNKSHLLVWQALTQITKCVIRRKGIQHSAVSIASGLPTGGWVAQNESMHIPGMGRVSLHRSPHKAGTELAWVLWSFPHPSVLLHLSLPALSRESYCVFE